MSRKQVVVITLGLLVFVLVAFGGQLSGALEQWLLALHGKH